jgi:hypothetical protein
MIKEEFDKLVNFETRYEEYQEIEAEYTGTDIDKVKFAVQWKKNGGIERIYRLRTRRIEELEAGLKSMERNLNEEIFRIEESQRSYSEMCNERITALTQERDSWKEKCEAMAAEYNRVEKIAKAAMVIFDCCTHAS